MAYDHLFVDTWGWLVLADRETPAFNSAAKVRRVYFEERRALVTTDYVLDETITRLFAARPFTRTRKFFDGILESQKLGQVIIEWITAERFRVAYDLRLRFRDKPRVSFTDLTSFVVMRELGIRDALTADAHFNQAGFGFRTLP